MNNSYDFRVARTDIIKQLTVKDILIAYYKCPQVDKILEQVFFFRHMPSQGHVIMDVAYRLFPEADFMGMVHDTKHAIAWLKANAVA